MNSIINGYFLNLPIAYAISSLDKIFKCNKESIIWEYLWEEIVENFWVILKVMTWAHSQFVVCQKDYSKITFIVPVLTNNMK